MMQQAMVMVTVTAFTCHLYLHGKGQCNAVIVSSVGEQPVGVSIILVSR